MNDQRDERSERSIPWGVLLGLLIPVVYVFSIGPAIWVVTKIDPAQDGPLTMSFAVFYLPLQFVYVYAGEPEWFDSYVELWIQ